MAVTLLTRGLRSLLTRQEVGESAIDIAEINLLQWPNRSS